VAELNRTMGALTSIIHNILDNLKKFFCYLGIHSSQPFVKTTKALLFYMLGKFVSHGIFFLGDLFWQIY